MEFCGNWFPLFLPKASILDVYEAVFGSRTTESEKSIVDNVLSRIVGAVPARSITATVTD
jgi:hypothetical protein